MKRLSLIGFVAILAAMATFGLMGCGTGGKYSPIATPALEAPAASFDTAALPTGADAADIAATRGGSDLQMYLYMWNEAAAKWTRLDQVLGKYHMASEAKWCYILVARASAGTFYLNSGVLWHTGGSFEWPVPPAPGPQRYMVPGKGSYRLDVTGTQGGFTKHLGADIVVDTNGPIFRYFDGVIAAKTSNSGTWKSSVSVTSTCRFPVRLAVFNDGDVAANEVHVSISSDSLAEQSHFLYPEIHSLGTSLLPSYQILWELQVNTPNPTVVRVVKNTTVLLDENGRKIKTLLDGVNTANGLILTTVPPHTRWYVQADVEVHIPITSGSEKYGVTFSSFSDVGFIGYRDSKRLGPAHYQEGKGRRILPNLMSAYQISTRSRDFSWPPNPWVVKDETGASVPAIPNGNSEYWVFNTAGNKTFTTHIGSDVYTAVLTIVE